MMPLVKIRLIVLLAIPGLIAAAVPLAVMAQDAPRQTQVIEMIDETTLTVAELMALAAAERDAPTALSCCDCGEFTVDGMKATATFDANAAFISGVLDIQESSKGNYSAVIVDFNGFAGTFQEM